MKSLKNSLLSRLGFYSKPIKMFVLGREIRVRRETIKIPPDYDDAWTFALIKNSNVFYDVGANTGYFCLLSCLDAPSRKVVAFDANSKALTIAAENLFGNGFSSQVTFVLGLVSDKLGGTEHFYSVGSGEAGSIFRGHAISASKKQLFSDIETLTLDSVMENTGFFPDLIKMDIEGAESMALQGAKKIAAAKKTRFIVEMHHQPELSMEQNGQKVLQWCAEQGYDAYYLKNHTKISDVKKFSSRGRCHLYLQPKGWEYPNDLKKIQQGDPING